MVSYRSLRKFHVTKFPHKNGLPDSNGPLSLCLPSQVIALANSVVVKATKDSNKKRGQYKKYHLNIDLIRHKQVLLNSSTLYYSVEGPSHYFSTLAIFRTVCPFVQTFFNTKKLT